MCFFLICILILSVFCLCIYLYCFVVMLMFCVILMFCSCFIVLCIFSFVCTSVGLLPPGESPIVIVVVVVVAAAIIIIIIIILTSVCNSQKKKEKLAWKIDVNHIKERDEDKRSLKTGLHYLLKQEASRPAPPPFPPADYTTNLLPGRKAAGAWR